MPQAAAEYVAIVVADATASTALSTLAYFAAYAATTYALNKAAESLTRKPGKSGAGSGMEISVIDSTADGRIIYGTVRTGGINVIPALTANNPANVNAVDGAILHQVLALAVHECASFGDVYFDDDVVAAADITAVTGTSGDGKVNGTTKYKNAAWVRRYVGNTTQTVDFLLNAAFPTSITAAFKGRGVCYAANSFDWGKGKVYTAGLPSLSYVVSGKKCYDPRLDASPGAAPTNPAFAALTSNPALIWADFKVNTVYGQKADPLDVDWDTVVAAANVCDAAVAVPTASTEPRYTFNGLLSTGTDTADNEKDIIDAMMGKIAFNGKWRIFAGAWRAAEFAVAREDWVSISGIQATAGRNDDRFNGVVVYHVDAARKWQRVEAYRRFNDTYKSSDGGERIWIEMDQPYSLTDSEAQRKGEFLLRQSRNGIRLSGTLPPRFMKVRTWDNLALTFEDLGWVSKTFTVSSATPRADGAIDVVLVEEQDTDWTDLLEAEYNSPSTSAIPQGNPTTPTEPSSFSVTPLLGVNRYTFGEPVVIPKNMVYQILRSPGTLAVANSFSVVWEGAVNDITLPADPRSFYWYHSRAAANSYYSNLTPNTFGLGARPWIPPDAMPGNRSYPDGEFVFTIDSYWSFRGSGLSPSSGSGFVSSGGVTQNRGKYVWNVQSGVTGGTGLQLCPMRWDIDSKTSNFGPRTFPGQGGSLYVTMRVVNSFGFGFTPKAFAFLPSSSGAQPAEAGLTLNLAGFTGSLGNVNEWTTFVYTFTMPNSQYDHVRVALAGPTSFVANTLGTMEVGAMQVSLY